MSISEVVIYGSSGHALAYSSCVQDGYYSPPLGKVVAYIDDMRDAEGLHQDGAPIITFERWRNEFSQVPVLISLGNPHSKKRLADKVSAAGGTFANLYTDVNLLPPGVEIGHDSIILPRGYIATQVRIGCHVQIMPIVSIGHDVVIEDYCTLCPSVTISGYVLIEEGVFIGAGATITNGKAGRPLIIGRNTKIAAGAVVTKSTSPSSTMIGNPAIPIREMAGRSRIGSKAQE